MKNQEIFENALKAKLGADFKAITKVQQLGEGSKGICYKISYINQEDEAKTICCKRFKKIEYSTIEAQIVKGKKLPVEYDHFFHEENQDCVLLMPFINGTESRKTNYSRIPREDRLQIAKTLIANLEELHKAGILHRDLHDENILVVATKEKKEAKIIDFGRSAVLPDENTSTKNRAKKLSLNPDNSTLYKVSLFFQRSPAPEYINDEEHIGTHSDIYSIKKILKEMLPELDWLLDDAIQRSISQRDIDAVKQIIELLIQNPTMCSGQLRNQYFEIKHIERSLKQLIDEINSADKEIQTWAKPFIADKPTEINLQSAYKEAHDFYTDSKKNYTTLQSNREALRKNTRTALIHLQEKAKKQNDQSSTTTKILDKIVELLDFISIPGKLALGLNRCSFAYYMKERSSAIGDTIPYDPLLPRVIRSTK